METILYNQKDNIAVVTLNRPDVLNALSPLLYQELRDLLYRIADDKNIRVVILTGAGKAFAAGTDISSMVNMSPMDAKKLAMLDKEMLLAIAEMPKPVIAAINGVALGGGCEIILACDFRIASHKAKLGLPEVNLGVIPGGGGTQRLVSLIGLARTKELIFTGRILSAEEALTFGILNSVVEPDNLMSAAEELARTLATKSPTAIRLAKASINKTQAYIINEGIDYEIERFGDCFSFEDQKEGMRAFLEKRPAKFSGV